MSSPVTKTARMVARMRAGDWSGALSLAKDFRALPKAERAVIVRAHEAVHHPGFYRGLGKDPDVLIQAGIAALQARYGARAA